MTLHTPQLRRLWQDAQSRPEWATTKFWEYIFNHNAFSGRQWVVSSQQPPTYDDGDLRRVDLVVEQIDDSANVATLLFMEAKRANVTRDEVQQVEYQAFTACCANLYSTQRPAIWAMTCVGSRTRLWAFKYGADYLTPFFPSSDGLSAIDEYVEFSVKGAEIIGALDFIQKNPAPPNSVFEHPSSPRPRPILPPHWHDAEVAHVAAPGASESAQTLSPGSWTAQAEAQGSYLYAAQCTALVVMEKLGDSRLRCSLLNGTLIDTVSERWMPCGILGDSGDILGGFSYLGHSGTQYYTWTLEPKRQE